MFLFDAVTAYLLVVALATLLVAVLVWQPYRSQRTVVLWLASGVLGVLLGTAGSYAGMRLAGYELKKAPPPAPRVTARGGMKGMPGMGMGGMKGMPGMGMGGFSSPRPKRDLTTLVQKLDLLTGDIGITLTAEQAAAVNNCLKDVEKPAKMSDDEAKAKHDQLMAVLNETQKARLEAVGLPRPARGGPGMGGGMPGMMGGGAPPMQDENQNPFSQDAEGKAVKSLRDRLASKTPAAKAETPKSAPPKADAPKVAPTKAETKGAKKL